MDHGESGPRGLCVTRVVMEAREKDTGSATIHFLNTEELIAPEIVTKLKIAIQRAALVNT